ncbi:hypothetical protein [Salinirubrum litoreum]|uniref:Uncharacterized protein n=1 Tax=Salinirubrum litoreum TaxID=1126234 RepID=A0ABD5RE99_9EURY
MADDTAQSSDLGLSRRRLLGTLAGAGTAGLAGCGATEPADDGDTTPVPDDEAQTLAERFAPTLYFDRYERWFPTDPRPYESERDGETVVDGFDALEGYTSAMQESETPPDPAVFYNVVGYADSPLSVVQYWFYSAFDQFTTNFHWHDWEVLHVFVDTDSGEPQLFVASSHSRRVPNNEFLDPDPETVPRILAELGSHSSALSLNESEDRFDRLPTGSGLADITNSALEGVEDLADLPVAYGLPRDEGARLPYVVPELDGAPLYEHPDLPSLGERDLVGEAVTVRSFDALSSPPTDLPARETAIRFRHADRDGGESDDVPYELTPTSEVEGIAAFTGPQLSFEFAVPKIAEDAIAGHITTTSPPWTQERYENPAADITDPGHRQALADRYDAVGDPSPVNTVLASVRETVTNDDAPEGEGLTTEESTVESAVLLESDPEAVPTFRGTAVLRDVPAGDHRLTVNRAGTAPHSEQVSVGDEGPTTAGVDGEIPVVAREDAVKLAVDPSEADSELTDLAVDDDFAGRLYDAPLSGPDAVYLHRGGAFTTEVRDSDSEVGAFRVNPGDESSVRVENPGTGKAVLARYLADVSEETRAQIASAAGRETDETETTDEAREATATETTATATDGSGSGGSGDGAAGGDDGTTDGGSGATDGGTATDDGRPDPGPVRGLTRALAAITDQARRAAERAEAGDRGNADAALDALADRLVRAQDRLAAARDGLPPGLARATENRLAQADERAQQARDAQKL